MIEEGYSVNIYFLLVFDINLDVTLCTLLPGKVFHCASGLSCYALNVMPQSVLFSSLNH